MKRKVFPLLLAVVFVMAGFCGCSLFKSPVYFVSAVITTSGGSGLATVNIKKDSSSGTAVTNATVKMNGNSLVHVSDGLYGANVSGVTTGLAITLSIDGPDDTLSSEITAPATGGGVSTISISGAVDGSTFTVTCY